MPRKNHLTEGSVAKKLISLSVPMVFGMLSMVVFNLVDTFFVSRLGTVQLAAMGYTFPVIMLIINLSLGFGIATSSVVSRAIGRGDHHQLQRLTTDSLLISLFMIIIVSMTGLLSMDVVFRALGADGKILVFVKQYMRIWYMGAVFIVVPMIGNHAVRACGDTLLPSLIMITSTIINVILDPILIFGLFGFPRMELEGAAIATVIARFSGLVFSFIVIYFKEKLIDLSFPPTEELIDSVKQIFYVSIPSAVSRVLIPFTMAVIVRMITGFGTAAVAAFGVAVKIEMFVFLAVMALATALIPFTGQNWGGGMVGRVKEAVEKANRFSLFWGGMNFLLFMIFSVPLGHIFGTAAAVSRNITLYLMIIPVSYGLRGCRFLSSSVFNAINKPFIATGIDVGWMFILYIPFAMAGRRLAGLPGLFAGMCIANILAGLVSVIMIRSFLTKKNAVVESGEVKF